MERDRPLIVEPATIPGSRVVKPNDSKIARRPNIALTAVSAAAAGIGLFLWSRGRSKEGATSETSTEAEVEAHPS
jgi:hypothetical protein